MVAMAQVLDQAQEQLDRGVSYIFFAPQEKQPKNPRYTKYRTCYPNYTTCVYHSREEYNYPHLYTQRKDQYIYCTLEYFLNKVQH